MSLPCYERYKASGVDWIGEVPEGWDMARVKHFTRSIEQGWSPQCEGYPVETQDEWGVLKVGCVNGGVFNAIENKKLPADLAPLPGLAILSGDLLISRANTRELVGSAAVAAHNYPNLMLCDKLYRLRLQPEVCLPTFLALYLGTNSARGQIELAATGASSSMVNIGQSTILDLSIPLPTFDEQSAIVTFLAVEVAKIDALVAEQERLIALLKEKRQAVISQAVTKGLNRRASLKDSGVEWLGEVPEGWTVVRLGNLFQEANEKGDDDLPFLTVSIHNGISDRELDENEVDRKVTRSEDCSKYKKVRSGDLVYNMMRAWQGAFGAATINGMVSPAYVVARPRRSIPTKFLELLLRTPLAVEEMRRHSRGITDFRLRLYWEEFKDTKVAIPSEVEAAAICHHVAMKEQEFWELSEECRRSIDLLKEHRAALISAAVTGRIDVRGAAS